ETKNQKAVDSFVKVIDHETVTIKDIPYNIVENYRDAFNKEELERRYSDIMEKYDYIVADISDEKARLKGFYRSSYKKAPAELRISNLKDYILEYCNFGCAYYVLQRADGKKAMISGTRRNKSRKSFSSRRNRRNP